MTHSGWCDACCINFCLLTEKLRFFKIHLSFMLWKQVITYIIAAISNGPFTFTSLSFFFLPHEINTTKKTTACYVTDFPME